MSISSIILNNSLKTSPVFRNKNLYVSNQITALFFQQIRQYNQLNKKNDTKFLNSILTQSSSNIKWREVESLLKKLGATFQEGEGSRVKITLDGHSLVFHKPHGKSGMSNANVDTIANFLQDAGVKESK